MNTGIFNVSKPVFFLSEDKKFILGWGEKEIGDEVRVDVLNSTILKGIDDELTPEERGDIKTLFISVSWVSVDKKDRAIYSGRITRVE